MRRGGGSTTGILNALAPEFERATGHKVAIHFDSTPNLIKLATSGAPFDAGVHVKLGRRLMARSQVAEALVEFDAALALGPPNPAEAHTDRAEAVRPLEHLVIVGDDDHDRVRNRTRNREDARGEPASE